jgi:hypothetical protein
MRQFITSLIIFTVLLVGSCKRNSTPQEPVKYDSCLEFQVALRMTPLNVGDGYNDGEFKVITSNIVPIHREGGPGHVVSDVNGVIVEMQWSDVEPAGRNGVNFTDFRWIIRNRLLCSDSETRWWSDWSGRVSPNTQGFSTEFDALVTPVSIHPKSHDSAERPPPILFLRCRWLPSLPKVPDIDLRNNMPDHS